MIEEECECEGGSDAAWMATFADLMSLLLTFFVLLLSFANMDVVRFKMALGSVRDALGVQFKHPGDVEAVSSHIIEVSKQESSPNILVIEEIMMLEKVKKFIKEAKLEAMMEAELDERGVVIRIKGHILFRSGEATLRKHAPQMLTPVIRLAKAMNNQLSIQGHTDDRPIRTSRFPSNWELSTARAVATMRFLLREGLSAKRMNVAGYAHMRPVAPNNSSEGRASNRRVEFVFLRKGSHKTITREDIAVAKRAIERMQKDQTLMAPTGDGLPKASLKKDTPPAHKNTSPDIRPNLMPLP